MNYCLQLASGGLGTTYPNPMVGCVVVHQGRIIGSGWHRKAGEPHAEVLAIRSVKQKELLKESCLYVNLEPCAHHGKTPPCCNFIVKNGIPEVVIASLDPNIKVGGNGFRYLKDAGVKVHLSVFKKKARFLNRRFLSWHERQRPYVILKWAQSADGYIAPLSTERTTKRPHWITTKASRQLVHQWRTQEQAVLIGVQTAIDDNASLTARTWYGQQPLRVVIDPKARLKGTEAVCNNNADTLIISDRNTNIKHKAKTISIDFSKNAVDNILKVLHERHIQSVLIEGGAYTLNAFLEADMWDEIRLFKGSSELKDGIKAPDFKGLAVFRRTIESDELTIFQNKPDNSVYYR